MAYDNLTATHQFDQSFRDEEMVLSLTGIAARQNSVCASCTVRGNVIAATSSGTKQTTGSVNEVTDNGSVVVSAGCKLASKSLKKTAARFIIRRPGEGRRGAEIGRA